MCRQGNHLTTLGQFKLFFQLLFFSATEQYEFYFAMVKEPLMLVLYLNNYRLYTKTTVRCSKHSMVTVALGDVDGWVWG